VSINAFYVDIAKNVNGMTKPGVSSLLQQETGPTNGMQTLLL